MKVRVAYSGYDRIGEVIEFEFDWDSVTGVDPEEATVTQIQYAVREAISKNRLALSSFLTAIHTK